MNVYVVSICSGGFWNESKKPTLSHQADAKITLETYTRNQDDIGVIIDGEEVIISFEGSKKE